MDATSPGKLSAEALDERIRSAGLRVTRPRQDVYHLLHTLGGHHGADELVEELTHRGAQLSRATVFNVLHDLCDRGLIMQADAGPGRAIYEAADEWHHHFVCRSCGAIHDVPCLAGVKPCLDANLGDNGFEVEEAQVIFRGRCPQCRSEAAPTGRPPQDASIRSSKARTSG